MQVPGKRTPSTSGSAGVRRGKMDRSFLYYDKEGLNGAVADGPEQTPASSRRPSTSKAHLDTATLPGTRIVHDATTGERVIHLLMRNQSGRLMAPVVLKWHRYGDAGLAFAEALYGKSYRVMTIGNKRKSVGYFLEWFAGSHDATKEVTLGNLNRKVFESYKHHLDAARDSSGKPWTANTKRMRLGDIRTLCDWLRKSEKWKGKFERGFQFPDGQWTALVKTTQPRPVLADDTLRQIIAAAIREIEHVLERHEQGRAMIASGRLRLVECMKERADFVDMDVAVAAIVDWFKGYVRNVAEVSGKNPGLASAIREIHGAEKVFRFLYPSNRELVPFVILLTMHTAYNPQSILGIRLEQISVHDVFTDQLRLGVPDRHNSRHKGEEANPEASRLRAEARKGRAGGRAQNRSFRIDPDDAFGAYMLVEHVKSLTQRIRPHASSQDRDRLFIYHQMMSEPGIRSFEQDKPSSAISNMWSVLMKRFAEDNGLPPFTLASIRATMADVAERLTGDIRAVQLLLCHTSREVTLRHYLSAGGRKRGAESIAVGQGMRHRWAETGGKRDAREAGIGDTLQAATSGVGCLDPYDSPMPGQTSGKLCSAWLACFFCPLAVFNLDDGHSLARLIQLEKHILDARATIAAQRYLEAYIPLLQKIASWLEKFTPAARAAATAITHLKPLPELE